MKDLFKKIFTISCYIAYPLGWLRYLYLEFIVYGVSWTIMFAPVFALIQALWWFLIIFPILSIIGISLYVGYLVINKLL